MNSLDEINKIVNNTKPKCDTKQYRFIRLKDNGLLCLLISQCGDVTNEEEEDDDDASFDNDSHEDDSDIDMSDNSDDDSDENGDGEDDDNPTKSYKRAAVCMSVGVGSFYDPLECQGLAHFLEHMLFMGSSKYPVENDFDSFLTKAGGSSNAYTEGEHTSFYFSSGISKLEDALDRFAQFFVNPLMLEDAVDRELNAIESEFQLAKSCIGNHLQEIACHMARKDHPYSKFGWGNLKSLREDPALIHVNPLAMLREFYDKYYVAENMALCVQATLGLDRLEEMVVKQCSSIRKAKESPYTPPSLINFGLPLQPAHEGLSQAALLEQRRSQKCIAYVVPNVDMHRLYLSWQMPSTFGEYHSKAYEYVTHLLAHEADHSLLSVLRSRGLAGALNVGEGYSGYEFASPFSFVLAEIALTKEGVAQWKTVMTLVFEYIAMLKNSGPQFWIYEELQNVARLDYDYQAESDPEDNVQDRSMEMLQYRRVQLQDILTAPCLFSEYSPEKITEFLNYLSPDSLRVDLCSSEFGLLKDYESNPIFRNPTQLEIFSHVHDHEPLTEPHFGARFWIQAIDEQTLNTWRQVKDTSLFRLPNKNEFIATDVELKPFPADNDLHQLIGAYVGVKGHGRKSSSVRHGFVSRYWSKDKMIEIVFDDILIDPRSEKYILDESQEWDAKTEKCFLKLVSKKRDAPKLECTILSSGGSNHNAQKLLPAGTAFLRAIQQQSREPWDYVQKQAPVVLDVYQPKLSAACCRYCKVWTLQDRIFRKPKAGIYIHMLSESSSKPSPFHEVARTYFVRLVQESLMHEAYMANMAELEHVIKVTDDGVVLIFNGFQHKLHEFVNVVLRHMFVDAWRQNDHNRGLFAIIREQMERRYINGGMKSSKYANNLRLRCLRDCLHDFDTLLEVVRGSELDSFEKVCAFATTTFLARCRAEIMIGGNIDEKADSQRLCSMINRFFADHKTSSWESVSTRRPVIEIPLGLTQFEKPVRDANDANASLEMYFQVGPESIKDRVLLDLIEHVMSTNIYDELRTKKQLGYSVSCSVRVTSQVLGYTVVITSATHTAEQLEAYALDFMSSFITNLESNSEESFLEDVGVLMELKLEEETNMNHMLNRYWEEILHNDANFDRLRYEGLGLVGVWKEDVVALYKKYLLPTSPHARILSVRVRTNTEVTGSWPETRVAEKLQSRVIHDPQELYDNKQYVTVPGR